MKTATYIRNGEDRIPIGVYAITDEFVLYEYEFNGQNKSGCISRKLFDAEYHPTEKE